MTSGYEADPAGSAPRSWALSTSWDVSEVVG